MLFPVLWSTKLYGLDGPWHAISAQVGGYDNQPDPGQMTSVDLLPGGFWESFILSDEACPTNATTDCAKGGAWNPATANGGAFSEQTSGGQSISFNPGQSNFVGTGRTVSGSIYSQKLRLNGRGLNIYPGVTIPNSTLVSTTGGYQTWPNGRITSLELGNLALGADGPVMTFGNIDTYNAPGYLSRHNGSSNSYTIQIGSPQLDYPGSLIFGGYDRGRGLGSVTSWSDSPLMLHDIVLGVETGGSPWNFSIKMNLLLNNASTHTALPVYPEPLAPYLHLPDATCKRLAQTLPIYFDDTSRYYLWNTTDPAYIKTVTSAAYLGFVFPAALVGPTSSENIIKVPMMYLNLTLQPEASGLSQPVAYFPCQNYIPDYGPVGTAASAGGTYILGRAFLQAAILGRNWAQGVSWLAQAPGPGPAKEGLGYNPTEIQNSDTSISFPGTSDMFNKSMEGYWTPLPQSSIASNPTGTDSSSEVTTAPNTILSTGAKAGIATAVAVLALLSIGFVVLLYRKRRSVHALRAYQSPRFDHKVEQLPVCEVGDLRQRYYEADAPQASSKHIAEMSVYTAPHEMDAATLQELDSKLVCCTPRR